MTISLTEFLEETRIHIADSQCQTAYFDDDDLTLYINNALITLWSLFPPDALSSYEILNEIDLINGRYNYGLPTDYYIEYSVIYNDIQARKLKYSDHTIINQNTFVKSLASQPGFTINYNTLYLYPTPTANAVGGLQLFYLAKPPILEEGVDFVSMNAVYKSIISKLAGGRAIEIKESLEEGQVLVQSALDDLKIMTEKDLGEE